MGKLTRILVLGLGAGLGVAVASDTVSGMVASLGFSTESKAGKTITSAASAGIGVFVAETVLQRL